MENDTSTHFNSEDFPNEEFRGSWFQRALVNRYQASDDWDLTPQYYAVKEANQEIAYVGRIINNLNWNPDKIKTLMPTGNSFSLINPVANSVSVTAYDPTGIGQHTTTLSYFEGYQGFVECSIYDDNLSDFFMLVNRRGNFPLDSSTMENSLYLDGVEISQENTDLSFVEAESQNVDFVFDGDLTQNCYTLHDLYTDEYFDDFTYNGQTSSICVEMEAGEAKLLKLEQRIPAVVDETIVLANTVIHNTITIPANKQLILLDGVYTNDNACINVEPGGELFITGTNTFSSSSSIIVSGSLDLTNGTLKSFDSTWQGITVNNTGSVNVSNCIIKDAVIGINAIGSSVIVENDCQFENCQT